jgi:hypothetical protein
MKDSGDNRGKRIQSIRPPLRELASRISYLGTLMPSQDGTDTPRLSLVRLNDCELHLTLPKPSTLRPPFAPNSKLRFMARGCVEL